MGCIQSGERVSKKRIIKVVLLGIGGSGKTTFSKQMQIIHQNGFDQDQAGRFKGILLANLFTGIKTVLPSVKDFEQPELYKLSRRIQDYTDESEIEWNPEMVKKLQDLYKDPSFQTAWKREKDSSVIQLEYMMDNLERFLLPEFVPGNEDILRARQRTTGESISNFEDNKNVWTLIDVGGQFSEREKWEDVFAQNKPHAIIFFLAVDEFNVPNGEIRTENEAKTKFDLAMSVFRQRMCGEGPVRDYGLCRIVFLNKVDLFQEKIKDDERWALFKEAMEYNGEREVDKCMDNIKQKMETIRQSSGETEPLTIHVTCALDTEMMSKVVEDIKVSIVRTTMKDLGMTI